MTRAAGRLLGAMLAAGALAAYVATHFAVSADITAFLPTSEDRSLAQFSRAVARGPLSRTMVLLIGASDDSAAVAASRSFERALLRHPEVGPRLESIDAGVPPDLERQLWDLYHDRRLGFVAEDAETAHARASDEALRESAQELVRRLRHPDSSLTARLAPSDPLFILPEVMRRFQGAAGRQLRIVDGRLLVPDHPEAVLFLVTRASAFDSTVQAPLLEGIEECLAAVREESPGSVTLQQSGVNRFALRAEESIRSDIQRIAVFSSLGLALLLWVLFRGFRLVGLAAVAVGLGMLAGCVGVLALYGRIHGVTLAFGASLIGVCVDYVIHFYCHQSVVPSADGAFGTLRAIWKPVATGALTTMVGFAALAASAFPGLREVGVFSLTGVFVALLATRWVVPALVPDTLATVPFRARLVRSLGDAYDALRRRPIVPWAALAGGLLLGAAGLTHAGWSTDFTSLNRLDPELHREDEAIRDKVVRLEQMRFVVATGATDEEALRVNDRVARALHAAREAGEVRGYRSVAPLLPSVETQRSVARAFRDSVDLWSRFSRALSDAGVDPAALEPFRRTLQAPLPPAVSPEELLDSSLGSLVGKFRVELDEGVAWLSFLHDVRDAGALRARLAAIPGAQLVDRAAMMEDANRAYQERTLELITLGLVGVFLVLVIRYRRVRSVLAAFLPAVLAASVTVSILTALGIGLDLLSLTALLVVVSVGVDYGVFLVDADEAGEVERSAALLSIVVACVSTILGFGLLSLSSYPALHVIGLTAAVGVTASFVFAPTALILLKGRQT